MSKKHKGFNPTRFVFDNATISIGTMASASMVSNVGKALPSPVSDKIMQGMEPIAMIPSLHAVGGIFDSLKCLEDKTKKRRR